MTQTVLLARTRERVPAATRLPAELTGPGS
jgi:hypothetical protein